MLGRIKGLGLGMTFGPRGMPLQLSLIIEPRPQFGRQSAINVLNIGERKIGFKDRRPGGAPDFSGLLALLAVIEKCFTDRFISVDDNLCQAPLNGPGLLGDQSFATGKMTLVEIHHPSKANLVGRSIPA